MFFENPNSDPRRKLRSIDYYYLAEIIIHLKHCHRNDGTRRRQLLRSVKIETEACRFP